MEYSLSYHYNCLHWTIRPSLLGLGAVGARGRFIRQNNILKLNPKFHRIRTPSLQVTAFSYFQSEGSWVLIRISRLDLVSTIKYDNN